MKKDDDLDATLSPKSWTQIISSTLDEKRRQRINDSAKDGLAELEKVDEQATSEVLGKAVIGRQNEIQESLSDEEIEEIEREIRGRPGPDYSVTPEPDLPLSTAAEIEQRQLEELAHAQEEPHGGLAALQEEVDGEPKRDISTWREWAKKIRRNQRENRITIEHHLKAWEIYKANPTVDAIKIGMPELSSADIVRLVKIGNPSANIPSLERKLAAVNLRVNQMDVDETAKSIATGRFAIRRVMEETLRQINEVLADPERSAKVPPRVWLQALPKFVALNEEISRTPIEGEEAAVLEVSGDVQGALGGLLDELARRRIPMTDTTKALTAAERKMLEDEDG